MYEISLVAAQTETRQEFCSTKEIRHLLYVYLYILETVESIQNLKLVFLSSLYSPFFGGWGVRD